MIALLSLEPVSYNVSKKDFYVTRHTTGHLLPVGAGQWYWIKIFSVKRME